MFSSMSFMVLASTCRSFINLELIFEYGMNTVPTFILFHVDIQFAQHHLLVTYFPTDWSWNPC